MIQFTLEVGANMSSNETLDNVDFFEGLYSFRIEVYLCALMSLTAAIVLAPAVFGIIWYDTYISRNQTLVSRLNSRFLLTCMAFYPPWLLDISRFLFSFGRYSDYICIPAIVLKSVVHSSTIILVCIETVFYYRLITLQSQFPIIQDDLLVTIFSRTTLCICSCLVFVRFYLPGRYPLNYHLCTGQDPNDGKGFGAYQNEPNKSKMDILMIYVMVPMYFVYSCLIVYHQVKIDIATSKRRQALRGNPTVTCAGSYAMPDQGVKQMIVMIFKCGLWAYSMFTVGKVNNSNPEELRDYPGLFDVMMFHLIMPPFMIASVVIMQYMKSKGLRTFALREIRTRWQKLHSDLMVQKNRITNMSWR